MRAIEIGRRMVELRQSEEAQRAYSLALEKEAGELSPEERLEAAVFLLEAGGNYLTAYDTFLSLYGEGQFREEILDILLNAFYLPNMRELQNRYQRNVKTLGKYPWLFRKHFPDFDALPLLFFPYDEHTYVPFDTRTGEFLPKFSPHFEEITHYFFRDLEKPVLAEDIFSQYELEYLRDNVRRSEDVGRENHVYLHYTDWEIFCAYLQVWKLKELLKDNKLVFLFGEEISRYPIDFQAEFGIDYSQYPVRPVGIREIHKLIWHTQLSAHNGGDFFNEIFDAHPNLLFISSTFLSSFQDMIDVFRDIHKTVRNLKVLQEEILQKWENPALVEDFYRLKNPTDKDLLVAYYLSERNWSCLRDHNARIAPAIFFQPHFKNVVYNLEVNGSGEVIPLSKEADSLRSSAMISGFRYIKTFTPVRRFTGSYGGSMRFLDRDLAAQLKRLRNPDEVSDEAEEAELMEDKTLHIMPDILSQRVRNRSFLRNPEERLYRDSIIVRLEDAKLNPDATLRPLAAFLDLPYGESMTYCSLMGDHDPIPPHEQGDNNYAVGFSLNSVYKTYDEYVGIYEKRYIEYLLRDAYQYFGYSFHAYDGSPVDHAVIEDWIDHFDTYRTLFYRIQSMNFDIFREKTGDMDYEADGVKERIYQDRLQKMREIQLQTADALMSDLRFVSRDGVPLEMGRLLKPDPALCVKPLYH